MNIVINAVGWSKFIKGVDRYNIELVRHLVNIDKSNQYFVFYGTWQPDITRVTDGDNVTFIPVKWLQNRILRHIWHSILFPFYARKYRPDIIHLPNTLPLMFKVANTVCTIHDELLEFTFIPKYGIFRSFVRRMMIRQQVSKSSAIIAVSPAVRKALIAKTDIQLKRIHTILNGINVDYFRHPGKSYTSNCISKPYILFVSVIDKNKNLEALVLAFDLLPQCVKEKYSIVVAGKKGNAFKTVETLIRNLELERKVKFLGHVMEGLPHLYTNADMFIMPSYYEGFSLPVLEAMAAGVPVIVSQNVAIAEMVKDGVLLFDPESPEALMNHIKTIANDHNVAAELRQNARRVIKRFSWSSTARATLDVYRALVRIVF